jgi:tRNA (adenine57-N1/adenine58-N1)-methyltransferase
MNGDEFASGDCVLLVDAKGRRWLIDLVAGGEFHSHAGILAHDDLIGSPQATEVQATGGKTFVALRPTFSEFVLKMKRRAQVVYPKDLGAIVQLADIAPGSLVVEAGVGSAALTMALLRAVGPTGRVVSYELREDHAEQAVRNIRRFLGDVDNHELRIGDVADTDIAGVDRFVLDLPEPWEVVPAARRALRPGGLICTYLPTVPQVQRVCAALAEGGFGFVSTVEVLHRTWKIEGASVRPDHRMVAHTAFLTTARSLAEDARIGRASLPMGEAGI